MRVGLVSTAVGLGGAERYLVELAKWISARGAEPVLIVAEEIADLIRADLADPSIAVHGAAIAWDWGPEDSEGGPVYLEKLERQRAGFAAALKALVQRPDTLLLNANWPTHYIGTMQAAVAAGLSFGVHFHLCPHLVYLNPQARSAHAEVLPQAAFLGCVSENNRFFLERTFMFGARPLDFKVVLNGSRFEVDDADRSHLAKSPRENVALLVGRLDHQKGILDILPALYQPEALAGMALHVLGDGPLRPQLEEVAQEGAVPVELCGKVSDVRERLSRARVMVLPSHFEGLSLSIIEAMSLGCIPIVARASSATELIEDGRTGFLFDVADWRSMLDAFHRFAAADEDQVRADCLEASRPLTRTAMLDAMEQELRALA